MIRNRLVIGILVSVFQLYACSDDELSSEDEINRFIESVVTAAENRELSELVDLIHPAYRDHNGYNRKQIGNLLRLSFFKNKNIHLFTRVADIELLADNQALVNLHVAMAGSAIADANALSSLHATVYKFELQLIKQDQWLLQQANWHPVSLVDMQ